MARQPRFIFPQLRPSPYHADYGLPDETRVRAIKDSELIGVPKAAKIHRVSASAIYKWRRDLKSTFTLAIP